MIMDVLVSFGALLAWFIVPAIVVSVVMRSTVVSSAVDSILSKEGE